MLFICYSLFIYIYIIYIYSYSMNISGSQPQVTCELRQVQKHGADLTKLENLQKQQSEAQQYGGASSPEVLGCSFLKVRYAKS